MVIILTGAAGAGKTTVGRRLSQALQWVFLDGDILHSPENIAKMAQGTPLTDEDRRTWLYALRQSIAKWIERHINAVLACSLLARRHRDVVLAGYETQVHVVYLRASRTLLQSRLTARTDHFAGVALLDSQLGLLEEPTDALVLDASQPPEQLVEIIRNRCHL